MSHAKIAISLDEKTLVELEQVVEGLKEIVGG